MTNIVGISVNAQGDERANNLPPLQVNISGKINHATYTKGEKGTVTFNRFPATVEEFKQVRDQIGGEPHGAVALQLMAFEMYRRDRTIGTECLRLNNTQSNVMSVTRRLSELFGNDAGYARPYQVAAYLKGAAWDKGYSPNKPYTIEIEVNNVDSYKYQYSNTFQTTVLYLNVLTQGRSKGYDTVEVLKTLRPGEPGEGKYFIILNSPGLYSQVREISFSTPFQGLE